MNKPPTEQPMVTVDVVLTAWGNGGLHLLLIERAKEPFKGRWALPGGKLATCDETLEAAARRELWEETGMIVDALIQACAYGDVARDPRGRYISVAYFTPTLDHRPETRAGDDAAGARWFPLSELPALAFDHAAIITQVMMVLPLVNGVAARTKK